MKKTDLIEKLIKQIIMKKMVISFLVCFVSFYIFMSTFINVPNYFFEIPEIKTILEADNFFNKGHKFVKIDLKDAYDTGHLIKNKAFSLINFKYKDQPKFIFKIIELGDGFLLIKAPYRKIGRELNKEKLIARLVRINDEASQVIKDIIPRNIDFMTEDKFFSKFPSTFLEIIYYDFKMAKLKLFLSFSLFLIFLGVFSQNISYFKNYKKTRLYKVLKITKDLKEKMNNEEYLAKGKDYFFFEGFFVIVKKSKVFLYKKEDIKEVSVKVINNNFLFFVKKDFYIVFKVNEKQVFELKFDDKDVFDKIYLLFDNNNS
ncbi:MAG: hypothetical protein BWY78_01193 [Alphaproteobacteria bacterium ADurb.Bin438]|nr:MAG: hypothetical protein BWY78_01193 [Alphaproteobacteria bacterium ADurb.Bin438]